MFKGQPKGLFVLALANMGERFGYYTMLAIFVLYMQAKFGFTIDTTSTIFGVFLSAVYFLPLFGGLLADKVLGYGKTITLGILVMFAGYFVLAIPSGTDSMAIVTMFGALLLIAMGTGCFKGNLQVLVGNLYDNPKYSSKRDLAFSIFYMCINIGAFFAPSAAESVSNYFMGKDGYTYNASVPALYHQLNRKEITSEAYVNLAEYATEQNVIVFNSELMAKYEATVSQLQYGKDGLDSASVVAVQHGDMAADSLVVAPVNQVQRVFGALVAPDQMAQVEAHIDSVINLSFEHFVSTLPTVEIRESLLASLPVIDDTAQLESVYVAQEAAATLALGSSLTEEQVVEEYATHYKTTDQRIIKLVEVLVNEKISTMIDAPQLLAFSQVYTVSMSTSFNYAFGVACLSLVISMLIFLAFRRVYASADKTEKQKAASKDSANPPSVELTAEQTKDRMVALGLVFAVVIFFWMAFHQNGLTMTFFARDYTQTSVTGIDRFGFSLLTLLPFAVFFYGVLAIFQGKGRGKLFGALTAFIGAGFAYWAYGSFSEVMAITPQIFQQFNAFFIVILTPVAVAYFSWLNSRNREPLAPRKIGIGMIIAAVGFIVLAIGSVGLPTPDEAQAMGGVAEDALVSPNWLISTYLILTIAELFLSPMGISFVSKVAPPKYKGLAQGGWLAATAIGNYLVAVVGYIWGDIPLWAVWGILVVLCLLSASFLFSQMKKLERTTREA